MYRLKRDRALSATFEAEFEKGAPKAIIFSAIALVLQVFDKGSNKLSIFGVELVLQDRYFLSGVFCAVAIFFGISTFLVGLKLHGAGWPSNYELYVKRYLFRRRNKEGADYRPLAAKRRVRVFCTIVNVMLLVLGIPAGLIYFYGVAVTFPNLLGIFGLF